MSAQSLFSRAFLVATAERAVRSFAASLASLLTASGAGILDVDWGEKFSVAAMASLVTVLFAIGGGTLDRKSTRLNSSHPSISRMPSSA